MNIFHMHEDPIIAAQMMCDKHVVKMIVESAQILSTAHRVLDGEEFYDLSKNGRRVKKWRLPKDQDPYFYHAHSAMHPSCIWARASADNYMWLYRHFRALCKEYTYRYGKFHATDTKMSATLLNLPKNIPHIGLTEFNQSMPDYCKREDAVEAYRTYYLNEKKYFAKWTKREKPDWWKECA